MPYDWDKILGKSSSNNTVTPAKSTAKKTKSTYDWDKIMDKPSQNVGASTVNTGLTQAQKKSIKNAFSEPVKITDVAKRYKLTDAENKLAQQQYKEATTSTMPKWQQRVIGSMTQTLGIDKPSELPTTGNKVADVVADVAGWTSAMTLPTGVKGGSVLGASEKIGSKVAEKAVKVLPKTVKPAEKVIKAGVHGAGTMSPLSLFESGMQGKDLKETGKNLAVDTALGLGLGVAGHGISKGIAKTVKAVKSNQASKEVNKVLKVVDEGTPYTKGELKKAGIGLKQQPKVDLPKQILLSKGNGIANNRTPEVALTKESQFKTGTLAKTPELQTPEIQNIIKSSEMMYEVKPNIQSISRAKNALDEDFYGNVKRIMNNSESLSRAEDTAMVGLITKGLAKEAQQTGNYNLLTEFVQKTRPKVTNTAQALQALKTWQMDTPEGVILYAQKLLDTANNDMVKRLGNRFKGIKFTPDDMKFIHNKAEEIFAMPQGRPRERAIGELRQYIGDRLPVSTREKFKAFLRMSMLSSPTTGLRNLVGNTLFSVAENIKQPISGLVDLGLSKVTGKRTTAILPNLKTQFKGMGEGAYRQWDDLVKGIDTSKSNTAVADMLDNRIGNTFKNPLLKKFEQYTRFLVRDDIYWQAGRL